MHGKTLYYRVKCGDSKRMVKINKGTLVVIFLNRTIKISKKLIHCSNFEGRTYYKIGTVPKSNHGRAVGVGRLRDRAPHRTCTPPRPTPACGGLITRKAQHPQMNVTMSTFIRQTIRTGEITIPRNGI